MGAGGGEEEMKVIARRDQTVTAWVAASGPSHLDCKSSQWHMHTNNMYACTHIYMHKYTYMSRHEPNVIPNLLITLWQLHEK